MRRAFSTFPSPIAAMLLLGLVLTGCQSGDTSSDTATAPDTTDGETMQQASTGEAPAIQPGRYTLDGAHSNIGFRIRHLGISSVEGNFTDAEATVTFPSEDLADMQAQATMPVSSIDTGNDDRDEHLRSGDFFDAGQYPEITFNTTNVNPTGNGNFEMTGDLTIKGNTQSVTLEGEYMGTAQMRGNTHAGFEARGEINRQDFGLTWSNTTPGGELVVGDNVELVLDVEAVRQGSVNSDSTAANATS